MLFAKNSRPEGGLELLEDEVGVLPSQTNDDIETVVGPSVNVEGDLSSAGNIIVKGTVSGSVNTTKHLTVEKGAKIIANVKANSASISGEVKGNLKVRETLELTSTSKILGDIAVKTLSVEPGALVYGKITMPGVETAEKKENRVVRRLRKEITPEVSEE